MSQWRSPGEASGDECNAGSCLIHECNHLIYDLNEYEITIENSRGWQRLAGQKTVMKTVTRSDQACSDSNGIFTLGKVEAVNRSRLGFLA